MEWIEKGILLLLLVSWAAMLGGSLTQLRATSPEISTLMLIGSFGQLISGVALMVIAELAPGPVNHLKIIIALVVMLLIAVLSVLNRRFESVPPGLLRLLLLATVGVMVISVFWGEPLQLV